MDLLFYGRFLRDVCKLQRWRKAPTRAEEEDSEGNRIEPDRTGKLVPAWSRHFKALAMQQADIEPWKAMDIK